MKDKKPKKAKDESFKLTLGEMLNIVIADALGIKVTKDDVKDYLEKKLNEFEKKEQYERCAEVLEDIKKLEKMV
jgi:hypothetical protein